MAQDAPEPGGSLPAGTSPAGSSVTLDGVWLIAMETRPDATGIVTADGSLHGMAHGSACGVIPEPMYAVEELAGGGAVISNVCAAVPSSKLSGAQWQVTVYGDDYSTTTGFLALT